MNTCIYIQYTSITRIPSIFSPRFNLWFFETIFLVTKLLVKECIMWCYVYKVLFDPIGQVSLIPTTLIAMRKYCKSQVYNLVNVPGLIRHCFYTVSRTSDTVDNLRLIII